MAQVTRLYKDLDLTFSQHPVSADVAKKLDVNAVKQSLTILLKTQHYERHFKPELGSPIYRLLFEPMDPITTNVLKQNISELIQNFEPRVRLNSLEVNANYDHNQYDINIYFQIVGLPGPVVYSTFLKRMR